MTLKPAEQDGEYLHDAHCIIAEALACGGPVEDELGAATAVLDGLARDGWHDAMDCPSRFEPSGGLGPRLDIRPVPRRASTDRPPLAGEARVACSPGVHGGSADVEAFGYFDGSNGVTGHGGSVGKVLTSVEGCGHNTYMTTLTHRPETGITWIATSRGEQGPMIDVLVPGRRPTWRRFMVTEIALANGHGWAYGYRVRKSDNVVCGNCRPIPTTLHTVRTVVA